MVDGLERVKVPCAVVDLDGTVIRGNSMHEMIRFMLRESVRAGELLTAVRLLHRLGCRRLRLSTHREMKFPIHQRAARFMADPVRMSKLMARLRLMVNQEVAERLMLLKKDGYKIIIATAAPEIYMPHLAETLGADCFTATPLAGSLDRYIENRGERKLLRAKEVACANGWDIRCVVTDHEDDLPLLMLPGVERILVSPSDSLCDRLRELKLSFSVIR